MVTYCDYRNELQTNFRKPIFKVQFLRNDESVAYEVTNKIENGSGSLNINTGNGVRRSVDFTLSNFDKGFIPNIDRFWIRQKIKLWMGLEINGENYFIEQGVFVIENPSIISNHASNTIQINATDKFCLLDGSYGGEIDGTYVIPVGTNIYIAIKSILQLEFVNDLQQPILDTVFNSEVTPYTITKESGDDIGSVIIELAEMLSANVYYNTDGRLVFEQDTNDSIKGSLWDIGDNEFNYLGATQDFAWDKVYNAVLVIGDNVNGEIFDYKAENSNLLSPTSIPILGFTRTLTIKDSNIYTTALAQERAEYELKKVTAIQNSVSVDSVPCYHLDVDNVITLTDGNLNLNKERYLIQGISIPFAVGGNMNLNLVKTEELI